MKQLRLTLILLKPNIANILFQHIISIKIINEIFKILFFPLQSLKSSEHSTLTEHLNVDEPHLKCSVTTTCGSRLRCWAAQI